MAAIPRALVEYYDADDLLTTDLFGQAHWVIARGSERWLGPALGSAFTDAVFDSVILDRYRWEVPVA